MKIVWSEIIIRYGNLSIVFCIELWKARDDNKDYQPIPQKVTPFLSVDKLKHYREGNRREKINKMIKNAKDIEYCSLL